GSTYDRLFVRPFPRPGKSTEPTRTGGQSRRAAAEGTHNKRPNPSRPSTRERRQSPRTPSHDAPPEPLVRRRAAGAADSASCPLPYRRSLNSSSYVATHRPSTPQVRPDRHEPVST